MGRPVSRVSRVLVAGPLASYAGAYERELGKRGYTRLTSVNLLRQMARLSRWVEDNGLAVGELTGCCATLTVTTMASLNVTTWFGYSEAPPGWSAGLRGQWVGVVVILP